VKKVLLIILDGFGEGKEYAGNALYLAKTPTLDRLRARHPWTLLKASGNAVGVPEGTQGGSEIGHLTIGAGRVVLQPLEGINRSIEDGSFFKKQILLEACKRVREQKSALHLLGMLSDQGVHAHIDHLFALLKLAKEQGVPKVFIHIITDGRDVREKSATEFIHALTEKIKELEMEETASIATLMGRYFAMDRDDNWDRTQEAYDLLTLGKGTREEKAENAILNAYEREIKSDYYLYPVVLDERGTIHDEDAVIFFNFRSDRTRQLTYCFTGEKEVGFKQEKAVRPFFVCMGPYSNTAPIVFPAIPVQHNLGEVVAKAGLKQLRIAETEKYAHVTYFFNSQLDHPVEGEERILIDSPKTPSYAQKPEMSAREITDKLVPIIADNKYDFIVLNFANLDLVPHSANLKASITACEVIDECLTKILHQTKESNYTVLITGDHGNVEYMLYDNGDPCPSHSKNPVPLILVDLDTSLKLEHQGQSGGELKDVAPTILDLMKLEQPKDMTGHSLLIHE